MNKQLIVIVFVAAGFASTIGTPHLLLKAECSMFYNLCLKNDIACHYLGIQGRRLVFPVFRGSEPRHCSKITLQPLRWPLFQWAEN